MAIYNNIISATDFVLLKSIFLHRYQFQKILCKVEWLPKRRKVPRIQKWSLDFYLNVETLCVLSQTWTIFSGHDLPPFSPLSFSGRSSRFAYRSLKRWDNFISNIESAWKIVEKYFFFNSIRLRDFWEKAE